MTSFTEGVAADFERRTLAEQHDGYWRTRDGRTLDPRDMSVDHVRKCISLLLHHGDRAQINGSAGIAKHMIEVFERELERRTYAAILKRMMEFGRTK